MSDAPATVPSKNALVVDFLGHVYVTVNPGYATRGSAFCGALVWRSFVVLLTACVFVFAVAGQAAIEYTETDNTSVTYCSLWATWGTEDGTTFRRYRSEEESQAVAVLAAIFGFASFVLAAVSLGVWCALERRRRAEEEENWRTLNAYGHRRVDAAGVTDGNDPFPFTNAQVENRGQVATVPCELRELRRRTHDKNLTIVTLVLVALAGVFSVTTLGLMATDFTFEQRNYFVIDVETSVVLGPGLALFAVATGVSIVAVVMLAIPQVGRYFLCGGLNPQRCTLMVVDDAAAGQLGENIRRLMAATNPFYAGTLTGVPVELPAPLMDSILAAQQRQLQQQHHQQQQQQQQSYHQNPGGCSAETGVGGGSPLFPAARPAYGTAAYYEPPPQLFRVKEDPLAETSEPASVPTSVPAAVPASASPSAPASVPTSVPAAVPTAVPTSVPASVPAAVPAVSAPHEELSGAEDAAEEAVEMTELSAVVSREPL